jgi:hypothetical protein
MEQNPLPPAKKNLDFPTTQPINQDVMELVAGGGKQKDLPAISEAKQKVDELIKKNKIDPKKVVQIGSMAMQAISDPALYPIVVQNAVQNKIISQNELGDNIDYKLLGGLITAGKLADQIVKGGA